MKHAKAIHMLGNDHSRLLVVHFRMRSNGFTEGIYGKLLPDDLCLIAGGYNLCIL